MLGGRPTGNRRQSLAAPWGANTSHVAVGARRRSAVTRPSSSIRPSVGHPAGRSIIARSADRPPNVRRHTHTVTKSTPTRLAARAKGGRNRMDKRTLREEMPGVPVHNHALSVAEHLKALSQRWASEHRGRG